MVSPAPGVVEALRECELVLEDFCDPLRRHELDLQVVELRLSCLQLRQLLRHATRGLLALANVRVALSTKCYFSVETVRAR